MRQKEGSTPEGANVYTKCMNLTLAISLALENINTALNKAT